MEIIIVQWGYFALTTYVKQLEQQDENDKFRQIFMCFATQISNGFLSTLDLILKGFHYQAEILTRNLYEQVCMLLVMILDRNKADEYYNTLNEGGNNSSKVWSKYFRMSEMKKVLDQYEEQMEGSENIRFLKKWREKQYNLYTEYVHSAFIAIRTSTIVNDNGQNVEKFPLFNIWGEHVYTLEGFLTPIMDLSSFLNIHFDRFVRMGLVDAERFSSQTLKNIWATSMWLGEETNRISLAYRIEKDLGKVKVNSDTFS